MSGQIGQRSFLTFALSLAIMISVILVTLATVGTENFEMLLLNKNPFAISVMILIIGALFVLASKFVGFNE